MALGRPVNKDTRNKVIVHTIGDHRYASTKVYTVDADGKKHYAYNVNLTYFCIINSQV